jgi:outer membrane protein OmpA-like peptidoglycan-associated protein
MRFSVLLTATAGIMLASTAMAADAEKAAYSTFGHAVYDSQGDCVRTKWDGDIDPCAPPAPEPAPIAKAAPKPAPAPLPVVTRAQRTIYFNFDSAALTDQAKGKLQQLVGAINQSSRISGLSIHGYTDQFGSDDYNAKLAAKRAAEVKLYLDGNSKLQSSIGDVRGLGKASAQEECATLKARTKRIACMASERRVEIELNMVQ